MDIQHMMNEQIKKNKLISNEIIVETKRIEPIIA